MTKFELFSVLTLMYLAGITAIVLAAEGRLYLSCFMILIGAGLGVYLWNMIMS